MIKVLHWKPQYETLHCRAVYLDKYNVVHYSAESSVQCMLEPYGSISTTLSSAVVSVVSGIYRAVKLVELYCFFLHLTLE